MKVIEAEAQTHLSGNIILCNLPHDMSVILTFLLPIMGRNKGNAKCRYAIRRSCQNPFAHIIAAGGDDEMHSRGRAEGGKFKQGISSM